MSAHNIVEDVRVAQPNLRYTLICWLFDGLHLGLQSLLLHVCQAISEENGGNCQTASEELVRDLTEMSMASQDSIGMQHLEGMAEPTPSHKHGASIAWSTAHSSSRGKHLEV